MLRHRGNYSPVYAIDEYKELFLSNWKEGVYEGREFGFTSPAADKNRQHLFLMDSCINAYLLASIDIDKAKKEVRTLLGFLNPDGSPPMAVYLLKDGRIRTFLENLFWRNHLYSNRPATFLTQPPGHAEAVWEIYEKSGDKDFLVETAPAMKRIYGFFIEHRDPDGDFLVSIAHPYESMTDSLPEFDEALFGRWNALPFSHFIISHLLTRGYRKTGFDHAKALQKFDFESAMFNTIYSANLSAMYRILIEIGDAEADEFGKLAAKVREAIVEKLFDADRGHFVSIYGGENERRTTTPTISSLMPILLDINNDLVTRVVNWLSDPDEFFTDFPVPSVAKSSGVFNPAHPLYLWRGSAWMATNWYITRGLMKHGQVELAKEIARRSFEMVRKSGFREYYNSINGEGGGDHEHNWSALVFDMLKITGQSG